MASIAGASAIGSLKAFIRDARTVRADFSQTVLDRNMQIVQKGGGSMQFERPGKFRWIYEKPYSQLIVGDGSKVWFYDKDLNQVTVRRLDAAIGSSPAALLAGSNDIENSFDLAEVGSAGGIVWLEAKPKAKESAFEWVRLGFALDGTLKTMELHDNFGQTTVLTFSQLERNPKLAPELFKFSPPPGADVISE
jgi:outer membrane lipoprotein carrier protein